MRSVLADEKRFGEGYREHHRVGWEILSHRLRPRSSVITHFTLGAYVASGHETYLFFKDGESLQSGALEPNYVFYDLKSRYPLLGPRKMKEIHAWMVTNPEYRLIYSKDGFFLYERVAQEMPRRASLASRGDSSS